MFIFLKYLSLFLPMIIVSLIPFILPLFITRILKALPLLSSNLREQLFLLLHKSKLDDVKLYTWSTEGKRTVSEMIVDIITKKIYISDYLIKNCNIEEIEAILAHEVGHLKLRHSLKRLTLTFLWIPLTIGIATIGELIAPHAPFWIQLLVFGTFLSIYFVYSVYLISRIHDRQADTFALNIGIDPEVLIAAIYKLTKLNNKSLTRSSLTRRINWFTSMHKIPSEKIKQIQLNVNSYPIN